MKIHGDTKVNEAYRTLITSVQSFAISQLNEKIESLPEMSPIEQIMWLALENISLGNVGIEPRAAVGRYRVDFRIEHDGKKLVVECDGHDFHERTKQQAAHDKKRDRVLQSLGYKVFRFTGSEIWQDAARCAREVAEEIFRCPI